MAHPASDRGEKPVGILRSAPPTTSRTLGIPVDPVAAADVIADGLTRRIDVGKVNDAYFLNVASVGLSVKIAERQDEELKRQWGIFSYVVAAASALNEAQRFEARITCGERSETVRAYQIAIGNGIHFGGGMTVSPEAEIDDGLLDVYAIERLGSRAFALAPRRRHVVERDDVAVGPGRDAIGEYRRKRRRRRRNSRCSGALEVFARPLHRPTLDTAAGRAPPPPDAVERRRVGSAPQRPRLLVDRTTAGDRSPVPRLAGAEIDLRVEVEALRVLGELRLHGVEIGAVDDGPQLLGRERPGLAEEAADLDRAVLLPLDEILVAQREESVGRDALVGPLQPAGDVAVVVAEIESPSMKARRSCRSRCRSTTRRGASSRRSTATARGSRNTRRVGMDPAHRQVLVGAVDVPDARVAMDAIDMALPVNAPCCEYMTSATARSCPMSPVS
jgi:hypothetical protein